GFPSRLASIMDRKFMSKTPRNLKTMLEAGVGGGTKISGSNPETTWAGPGVGMGRSKFRQTRRVTLKDASAMLLA
ncbi:MAG: hypothetical protein ABIV39_15985, partial [Verrucomicrobiota bacterium]